MANRLEHICCYKSYNEYGTYKNCKIANPLVFCEAGMQIFVSAQGLRAHRNSFSPHLMLETTPSCQSTMSLPVQSHEIFLAQGIFCWSQCLKCQNPHLFGSCFSNTSELKGILLGNLVKWVNKGSDSQNIHIFREGKLFNL